MNSNIEKELDGICLDPSVKFQTIMKTFNDLKEGEGFILKNDHDPKPLYYHLTGEHGDTFTWEYLEEGPEIFRIRIVKKGKPSSAATEESTEFILDGISLDPSVKFQTIMKTFNNLKSGESFVLHNDHDPKPLYYQLSANHGETFTWEYLKQGPDAFDIRIGKKNSVENSATIQPTETKNKGSFHDRIIFEPDAPETARTIVAKDFRKAKVFAKYKMDYAWDGDRSVAKLCEETGANKTDFLKELAEVENDFSEAIPSRDYYHWDMAFLADFILKTHHQYVKDNAERISAIAEEVTSAHGKDFPYLKDLGEYVRPMIDDFMVHMSKEEDVLFPAIKHMLHLLENKEHLAGPGGDIARGIKKMEEEHDETKAYLEHFRKITNGYTLPEGACEAQKQLYRDLQLFENDAYLHVHLENNILFPKTIILEKRISKG